MPGASRMSDDPLSLALRPPDDETTEQRAKRLKEEEEALRVSEAIDRELNKERAEKRRGGPEVKILLLGPSCAGKSTVLKNFQLSFTPKALQAEAATYAALVFLNVIASVRLLRDVLREHHGLPGAPPIPEDIHERAARLQSVVDLESGLTRHFGEALSQPSSKKAENTYEFSVRSGGLFGLLQSSRKSRNSTSSTRSEEGEHVRTVLESCREDIEAVAEDPGVRELLASRSMQLEHLPGYFLKDLQRITGLNYSPSDDDILRTRVRTLGISEMQFTLESGHDKGQRWIVVDVGGARNQRAAWVPYFDDASAVIFMASIGDFDQFLEEEASVNCIRDALELWENIVSQKLLEKAEFILFLNKYDMLKQKLDAGVDFSSFITSYRDKNDAESVGRYLQKKFTAIHRMRSPKPRKLHCHFTSVTDKSATVALLAHFRVAVLQKLLKETTLI